MNDKWVEDIMKEKNIFTTATKNILRNKCNKRYTKPK